jgi:hypothetical protein
MYSRLKVWKRGTTRIDWRVIGRLLDGRLELMPPTSEEYSDAWVNKDLNGSDGCGSYGPAIDGRLILQKTCLRRRRPSNKRWI